MYLNAEEYSKSAIKTLTLLPTNPC